MCKHWKYTHEKKDNHVHDNSLVFLTTKAREFVKCLWEPGKVMPKYMNMLIPSIPSDTHGVRWHWDEYKEVNLS